MTARELAASARNALLVVTLADGATPDEARELHAAAWRVEAVLSELVLRLEERDAADAAPARRYACACGSTGYSYAARAVCGRCLSVVATDPA